MLARIVRTQAVRAVNACRSSRSPVVGSRVLLREYRMPAIDIRNGTILDINGRLLEVTGSAHSKVAMRRAYMMVDLKDIKTGSKAHERMSPDDMVEAVELEKKTLEFVGYNAEDSDYLDFTNTETQETVTLPRTFFGEFSWMYFFEGMRVYVNYHEEDPITYLYIDKESLVLVTEAPDIEKSSSTSRGKLCTLENGRRVKLPNYVVKGEEVYLKIEDETFSRKAD